MLYRLCEDLDGLFEGSCISEEKFKKIYYTKKVSFEPVNNEDIKILIELKDENYCAVNGVDAILFYNQKELDKFIEKRFGRTD